MDYAEKEIERVYWRIGEVASMFNVERSMIRFWEVEFKMLHTKRNRQGFRQFMKADIEAIREIHHLLKVRRFTIEGAKLELAAKEGATV